MTYNQPTHCRQCGSSLRDDTRFCEACGAPVTGTHSTRYADHTPAAPKQQVKKLSPSELGFPAVDVIPRLGPGLQGGWDIVAKDIWGAIVCILIILAVSSAVSWVPVLGTIVTVAMYVGFFAWAESVRTKNTRMEVGLVISRSLDNFGESVMPGIILFLYTMVVMVPLMVMYFFAIVSTAGAGAIMESGGGGETMVLSMAVWILFFGFIFLLSLFSPVVTSWLMMSCWGIFAGASGGDSMKWAWERIKARPFHWWFVGWVLSIISTLGVYLCYIGFVVTMPWAQASWLVAISDTGETASQDSPSEPAY